MLVTISGGPGTGTTTVAKELQEITRFSLIHVGERFRDKAKAAGMPLQEYLEHANANPDVHRVFDRRIQEEANTYKDCIVEGRIAGFVIDSDLDVLLTCPPGIVAERVAQREGKPYDLAAKETYDRMRIERQTYQKIYGFDLYQDTYPFGLIINTDMFDQYSTAEIIADAIWGLLEEAEINDSSTDNM
jgi:cytidylate kinase